jgi:hypothetical protein
VPDHITYHLSLSLSLAKKFEGHGRFISEEVEPAFIISVGL